MNLIKVSWIIQQQEEDKYAGILIKTPAIMTVDVQQVVESYALQLPCLFTERDSHAP
jgi:hypothetical protein